MVNHFVEMVAYHFVLKVACHSGVMVVHHFVMGAFVPKVDLVLEASKVVEWLLVACLDRILK